MLKSLFVLILLGLSGCNTVPTVAKIESQIVIPPSAEEKLVREFAPTVILDAREIYEYELFHVPSSHSTPWKSFSGKGARGLLDSDLERIARRLALLGVSPESHVLVLGHGPVFSQLESFETTPVDEGAEGRIAWMLQYLGVKNVETLNHKVFLNQKASPREKSVNAPFWKPDLQKDFLVNVKDLATLEKGTLCLVVAGQISADGLKKIEQNSKKHLNCKKPLIISWKKFYQENSQVDPAVKTLLAENKVNINSSLLVISPQGIEASSVVYALKKLGFSQSRILHGGLEVLK